MYRLKEVRMPLRQRKSSLSGVLLIKIVKFEPVFYELNIYRFIEIQILN